MVALLYIMVRTIYTYHGYTYYGYTYYGAHHLLHGGHYTYYGYTYYTPY